MQIKPYEAETGSKKEQVTKMFNQIARRYDLLNRILSLGIDQSWRKTTIKQLQPYKPKNILDLATGTGDLALACSKLNPDQVWGLDIAANMLEIAKTKAQKYETKTHFEIGDALNLPFENNYFEAVTCAFGIRNFQDYEEGLKSMYRVLKPGGICAILELSTPTRFPMKQLNHIYNHYILRAIAYFISRDRAAYDYLPKSISLFPPSKVFLEYLQKANFRNCRVLNLTFGVCCLYLAEK